MSSTMLAQEDYRERAKRYRSMARYINDPQTVQALCELAEKYEKMAASGNAEEAKQKGDGTT